MHIFEQSINQNKTKTNSNYTVGNFQALKYQLIAETSRSWECSQCFVVANDCQEALMQPCLFVCFCLVSMQVNFSHFYGIQCITSTTAIM